VLRSELQSSGVSLVDCPHNGRKEVADKMLIGQTVTRTISFLVLLNFNLVVDMLAYAIDNPAPCTVVLITGDRDFSYALSILKLRRHRVVLITLPNAHPSLTFQACICFDWFNDVVNRAGSPNSASEATRSSPRARGVDFICSYAEEGIDSVRYFHDSQVPSNGFSTSKIRQDVPTTTMNIRDASFLPARNGLTHSTKPPQQNPECAINSPPMHNKSSIPKNSRVDEEKITINTPYSERAYDEKVLGGSNVTLNGLASIKELLNFHETPTQHTYISSSKTGMAGGAGLSGNTLSDSLIAISAHGLPSLPLAPLANHSTTTARTGSNLPRPLSISRTDSDMSISDSSVSPRSVPPIFSILVNVLRGHRSKGIFCSFRSVIAGKIWKNGTTYRNAGVTTIHEYLALAEREGIVELGGDKNSAWVSLSPRWA
jgi:hypothetical protein